MGPTASGKTDLALALAGALSCEIISVDSALVYRSMDIGTAKPSRAERALHPHHLIDIRDPAEPYSAADFVRDASVAIDAVVARGRTPLLVGGTMLYFKALLEGLSPMPESDPQVRAEIEAEANRDGWPALHARLAEVDPVAAARLHPNHSQRISRALEVVRISGRSMTDWQSVPGQGIAQRFDCVQMALAPKERSVLHQRIADRFDRMLKLGFIEEVHHLFQRPDLTLELPSMRAVGYRQVWQFLAGELSQTEMRDAGVSATRQLAKRQLTWLRSWHDLRWIDTMRSGGVEYNNNEILRQALNIVRAGAI